MKIFNFYLSLIVSLFFIACSSKYEILENSLEKQKLEISKLEKEELKIIYEDKMKFWKKYPSSMDLFLKNNFTTETKYLRSKFVGKNINEVKEKIQYQELYTHKIKNFDLYEFKDETIVYSFVVQNFIVKNVYVFE